MSNCDLDATVNRPATEVEEAYHRQSEHTAWAARLQQQFPREPGTIQSEDVQIQGVSVRATRNPRSSPRASESPVRRRSERRSLGLLYHEPPRKMRTPILPPPVS